MILTVTLNPAIDKIYWVDELKFGKETHLARATKSHTSAGGKGINVSIFLKGLGVENIATGFVAGNSGRAIKRSMRDLNVTSNFQWIDGETRTNVAILRKGKEDSPIEVNDRGPKVSERALEQFMSQYKIMLKKVSYVVISGSVPPNVPDDIYGRLVKQAKEMGVKSIVNTGEPHLSRVVKAGPTLLKPDIRESKKIMGEKLDDFDSIIEVGKKIVDSGANFSLISHEITGDVLVGDGQCWDLDVKKDDFEIKNEVGAGDSLIGGIVYKLQSGTEFLEAMKFGMASAVASVESTEKICRDVSLIHAELDRIKTEKLEC